MSDRKSFEPTPLGVGWLERKPWLGGRAIDEGEHHIDELSGGLAEYDNDTQKEHSERCWASETERVHQMNRNARYRK